MTMKPIVNCLGLATLLASFLVPARVGAREEWQEPASCFEFDDFTSCSGTFRSLRGDLDPRTYAMFTVGSDGRVFFNAFIDGKERTCFAPENPAFAQFVTAVGQHLDQEFSVTYGQDGICGGINITQGSRSRAL
jgi:hypothetical protein